MDSQLSSKEKILLCARELFYNVGYQATSVDDILKQCKVAKSNFYYHFESKEQLILLVLEQRIIEIGDLMVTTLGDGQLAPSERLSRFFARMCATQTDSVRPLGCPFGNFAAALPGFANDERSERFRLRLSGLFAQMQSALQTCLEEGVRSGEFRADIAPSEMAAFILATLEGLMILAKTHTDIEPLLSGIGVIKRLIRAV